MLLLSTVRGIMVGSTDVGECSVLPCDAVPVPEHDHCPTGMCVWVFVLSSNAAGGRMDSSYESPNFQQACC